MSKVWEITDEVMNNRLNKCQVCVHAVIKIDLEKCGKCAWPERTEFTPITGVKFKGEKDGASGTI